jgi:hypothetical protein
LQLVSFCDGITVSTIQSRVLNCWTVKALLQSQCETCEHSKHKSANQDETPNKTFG